jgi:hypothetical protein
LDRSLQLVWIPTGLLLQRHLASFSKKHSQFLLKKIRQTFMHDVVAQIGNVIEIKTNDNNPNECKGTSEFIVGRSCNQ